MGLKEILFPNKGKDPEKLVGEYFDALTAYQPVFTSFEGSLYEMELTRSAVHSFATQISKLKPEVRGTGNQTLERMLQFKPNPIQDTSKFLYRLATIYKVQNNVFIVPIIGEAGIVGYYPIVPDNAKFVEHNKKLFVIYEIGQSRSAIEFEKVGMLNQFQYRNDLFGDSNSALRPTLELMHSQNEGIIEGIKSSASIRFMARLAHKLSDADVKKEREKFTEQNLGQSNNTGVMMFDQRYEDVKQIISRPFVVDSAQMSNIKESVYSYFGTNENILQNKFNSDQWNAYYEGALEPFAIQLSLTMTNMTFTPREIAFGNDIIFTANRLQYASNTEKLNIVTQLFDRGFLTHNQGLEIFNMATVGEEGDKRYIRKEYAEYDNLNSIDDPEGEGEEV
jgi:hypothetical protein